MDMAIPIVRLQATLVGHSMGSFVVQHARIGGVRDEDSQQLRERLAGLR